MPPAKQILRHSTNDRVALLAIVLIALWYALTLQDSQDWGGDWSQYVSHAQNIATGQAYAPTPYFTNRVSFVAPSVYPPVYPALLAPIYGLFGFNLLALKSITVLSFCLSLGFAYRCFQHRLSSTGSLIILLAIGFNPSIWRFKESLLSDIPFYCACLGTLCFMRRLYANDLHTRSAKQNLPVALILGLAMYLAYGMREAGLVLPLTLITYELLLLRRISSLALCSLTCFGLLAWLQSLLIGSLAHDPVISQRIAELAQGQGREYSHLSQFRFDPGLMWTQLLRYKKALWDFYYSGTSAPGGYLEGLASMISRGVSGLGLLGFLVALRKRISVLEIFTLGYLCLITSFRGFHGLRYLLPLLPLMLYYAGLGFNLLTQRLAKRQKSLLIGLICLAIGCVYARSIASGPGLQINHGVSSPKAQEVWSYLARHAAADDVIVTDKPRIVGLMTQLKSCAHPRLTDVQAYAEYFDIFEVDYLLEVHLRDGKNPEFQALEPITSDALAGRLKPVLQNGFFSLFEVQSQGSTAAADSDSFK